VFFVVSWLRSAQLFLKAARDQASAGEGGQPVEEPGATGSDNRTLAATAFAGKRVLALWRGAPRGLLQKAEIVLILLWLGLTAQWLRNGPGAGVATMESSR
jgi:hypothetical protein